MFEKIVVQMISKVHPCHVDKRLASMWTASPNRGAHGLKARSVGVTTARSPCAWSVARTLNVSLPKVTRHFSVQLLLPWLVLCSAGGSITSQRLYLALETFWASWAYSGCAVCNVSHAGYWSFLTISDWVGLWHRRFAGSFCHACQFCWLDTDLLLALYGSAEQLCLSAV